MDDQEPRWPYWAALLLCIAAGLWFARDYITPLVSRWSGEAPAQVDAAAPPPGPRYPLPPSPVGTTSDPDQATDSPDPLPPLAASDGYFRDRLVRVFGNEIDTLLASDELITRFVAATDSLTNRQIPQRAWPVNIRLEAFRATPAGDAGKFLLSEENYARYTPLVELLTKADAQKIAAMYTGVYPLLQEAHAGLGYPNAYFNDRVVEVIDHLLATPAPVEPIALIRPHVLYQYADPELEALSGGQKVLVRMGNSNAAKLKTQLRAFRSALAPEPGAKPQNPAAGTDVPPALN